MCSRWAARGAAATAQDGEVWNSQHRIVERVRGIPRPHHRSGPGGRLSRRQPPVVVRAEQRRRISCRSQRADDWITTAPATVLSSPPAIAAPILSINGNAVAVRCRQILKVVAHRRTRRIRARRIDNSPTDRYHGRRRQDPDGHQTHLDEVPARPFPTPCGAAGWRGVVVGGAERAEPFTDNAAIWSGIWSPATKTSAAHPMQTPRTYHSTAILLPDGRVFVGGGGQCGTALADPPDGGS